MQSILGFQSCLSGIKCNKTATWQEKEGSSYRSRQRIDSRSSTCWRQDAYSHMTWQTHDSATVKREVKQKDNWEQWILTCTMLVTECKLRLLPVLSMQASVFYITITQECSCTRWKTGGVATERAEEKRDGTHSTSWRPSWMPVATRSCLSVELWKWSTAESMTYISEPLCRCFSLPSLTAGSAGEGSTELVLSLCGCSLMAVIFSRFSTRVNRCVYISSSIHGLKPCLTYSVHISHGSQCQPGLCIYAKYVVVMVTDSQKNKNILSMEIHQQSLSR